MVQLGLCEHYQRQEILNWGLISDSKSLLMIVNVEKCIAPGHQILPRAKKAGWQVLKPVPCCGQEA